jgi:hypothetical protein
MAAELGRLGMNARSVTGLAPCQKSPGRLAERSRGTFWISRSNNPVAFAVAKNAGQLRRGHG